MTSKRKQFVAVLQSFAWTLFINDPSEGRNKYRNASSSSYGQKVSFSIRIFVFVAEQSRHYSQCNVSRDFSNVGNRRVHRCSARQITANHGSIAGQETAIMNILVYCIMHRWRVIRHPALLLRLARVYTLRFARVDAHPARIDASNIETGLWKHRTHSPSSSKFLSTLVSSKLSRFFVSTFNRFPSAN